MKFSISSTGFVSKPDSKEIAQLSYYQVDETTDKLITYISNGYCFCNIYDFDDEFKFFGKGIKVNHYVGSYSINIDLDHQQNPMSKTYSRCPLKPTFCYTSWSNTDGNYSYRFIYCFDGLIEGVDEYKELYSILCKINNLDFDKNASSPYQYMNGSNKDCEIIRSDRIYNISEFDLCKECKKLQSQTYNKDSNNMNGFATFTNEEFKSDYFNLSLTQLLEKYSNTFINKESSDIPEIDEDIPMIELNDFYEIHRLFRLSDGRCIKLKDGQNRKHKLYVNCLVRRLITPSITFDDLLYDMLYELYHYVDNRNDAITRKQLIEIVNNSIKADIDKFKMGYKGRKSMVNPKYQMKYGLSKKEIANKANSNKAREKKEKLYEAIGELYDFNKTVNENLKDLESYGIKVSKRTIQNWKKENDLIREYKVQKPNI